MSEPTEMEEIDEERKYYVQEVKTPGKHLRTEISIEQVLKTRVLRKDLLKNEILKGMEIIRIPNKN